MTNFNFYLYSHILFAKIHPDLRKKRPKQQKTFYRTNEQIRANEVRVLDDKGKQLGVMKREEALAKAREQGIDLVEIAPKAKPPVAKVIEFGKFKYQEEKKLKKQKKGIKNVDVKELRFSPFIGEADYASRLKRIREFMAEGHKIRPVVKFKGRQMGSKQFGYNLLKRLLTDLEGNVNIDMEPKFIGRHLAMVISPVAQGKKIKDQEGKSDK